MQFSAAGSYSWLASFLSPFILERIERDDERNDDSDAAEYVDSGHLVTPEQFKVRVPK